MVGNNTGLLRESGAQSQRLHQIQGLPKGFTVSLNPLLASSAQGNHQAVVAASATQPQAVASVHQQIAYAMSVPDSMGGQQVQHQVSASSQSSSTLGEFQWIGHKKNLYNLKFDCD